VAFPAISAGAYGWDVVEVAVIAVAAVRDIADGEEAGSVELVRFVPFGAKATAAFQAALGSG
jgi:O-acetyl-ADP-ribose deacetylase (regulator of RNase III)